MAVKHRTFSNDLKAKDLCYSDEFFKLKSEKVIPSDSFTFDNYEALKDVNDFKTNNFSNLFLIKKQENSQWLEAQVKQQDKLNGLATTISWYAFDVENEEELGSWLYFAKNYEMFDINVSEVECMVTYGRPSKNYSNYIFYIELLDENTCRISHTFGDLTFYLCVQDDKSIHFSKNANGDREVFIYNLDDGYLRLYKKINHKIYDKRDEIVGSYNRLYLLVIDRNDEDLSASLRMSEDVNDETSNSLIYVNQNSLLFDFYLNGSWVTYDRNKYISSIDRSRSVFNLQTQALIHHEYNKDEGFNFIPLKNNLTYKGNSVSGNNTNQSDIYTPDVDYRTYTTINSGVNQERGTDNIILNFTFVDQEFEVNQGQDLIFTIPEKSLESTNLLDPLWPYKYINLNDTKFIKNGSFGSNVPYFSDKVKKLQTYKTEVRKEDGSAASPNNETYLCSWLYKPNHQSQSIWLDRYYYPDIISRENALKGNGTFDASFENILDKNYKGNPDVQTDVQKFIQQRTYFDKKSDLVIESGNSYRYKRISNDNVTEIVSNLEKDAILTGVNQSGKEVYIDGLYQFNNEDYIKLNYKDWGKTNAINFNADFYLQRDKRMGIQLFGTDYRHGFNIQNRKDLAPYQYYATDKILYLLNNKLEIVHQFDLYSKYEDTILKLFLGDIFDDIIVMSGIWMYIFSYDLRLKSRIDMTATVDGHNAIKGLDEIVAVQYEGISLINYPYNNQYINIDYFENQPYDQEEIILIQDNYTESFKQNFISHEYILIAYDTVDSGQILIPCNLCEIMCKQKPIIYNNNLYLPIKQNIVKIIMCPDCQRDNEIFNEQNRQQYPAAARVLHSSEYHLNYKKTNNSGSDTETLGVEQGFIEVENLIKHIFIDDEGTIYGLNFDEYAISPDGDTIYGLYASDRYIASGGWWWLFNQSLSKMKSDVSSSKYAEFASPNSIDKVKINDKGEMCLIRNFHNLLDNTNDDNYKRLEIYDKTKTKIYEYNLSSYQKVLTLDTYNYIDEAHEEQTCFLALCAAYGNIYKLIYKTNSKEVDVNNSNLPSQICPLFEETVNSNALLRYKDYNALYFNLNVPSSFTYDHLATIKWNLEDIQDGWYNINVMIDLQAAKFEVRINDEVHEIIDENTHWWFRANESANGTIFTSTYYLGILGKKYGTTLNKILKNSVYDPYTCKNLMINNLSIYKRKLQYYEYLAMRLRNQKVNRLILTLPCGTRNSMDEMVRFFKYNSSPAISNKVKINISGTGLQTSGEFEMLRKEIMAVLENNKDCLVTVKDIEFIENE